jgi:hypothetical protein
MRTGTTAINQRIRGQWNGSIPKWIKRRSASIDNSRAATLPSDDHFHQSDLIAFLGTTHCTLPSRFGVGVGALKTPRTVIHRGTYRAAEVFALDTGKIDIRYSRVNQFRATRRGEVVCSSFGVSASGSFDTDVSG